MPKKEIHRVLLKFNQIRASHIKKNNNNTIKLFPPKINTCFKQTEKDMLYEIDKFATYLKNPEFSYLNKYN